MAGRTGYPIQSAIAIAVSIGCVQSVAAQTDAPRLAWRIIDYAAVPPNVLQTAKVEAESLYAGIGVDMRIEAEASPDGPRLVTVIILDAHMAEQKDLSTHALGSAPGTPTQRGSIAYILYDRVESTARRHARAAGELLGLVMAHEIGHLLLPYNAHVANSIMQADWDSTFMTAVPNVTFTADHAAFIRSELGDPAGSRAALASENR